MLKSIAISAVAAGALGLAALGIGSGVANAAPSPVVGSAVGWAEHPGWGYGPGPWVPPPPPPAYGAGWGYGGYGPPPICATGPFRLVQVCS
ncbi:hypothetical protein A5731_04290 [Mycolicibacterium conceptionense]|uniref:Uncharacterized protein n=1 Tax=Mycolicibacterium conceptionense TaxID=451644 RepID=A0A1A1ZP16_9MYCO|nr:MULTISPECIES: hypothetical protein [Mycolicibacterium]MCW1819614.1 hypothetical protein [Mycolicibacterium senegalense]OBB12470.1 hypothetical protein A5718_04685 [Mycolicibacterium conceptionense]OBF08814.1 hypothetical protein A5731_04290 [Mycolicibacterium conceptionense]OBF12733.1 hypothetical protein A5726_28150 [Mycolicibacterium conceptionense]OBF45250.1 hypothetical protein A5720_10005 [Mycolicibacterium conceptionense]